MAVAGYCIWFITTCIVVAASLLALLSEVDASAKQELLMVRYDNHGAMDADGHHCDSHLSSCDHYFQFALDRGDSNNNPRGSHYMLETTGHFQDENINHFGGDMAGVPNPIVTSFNTWPAIGVKFKVYVKDKDGWLNSDDRVDGFVELLQLTPAQNISIATWTERIIYGIRRRQRSSLTFRHKLYCDANYYSSDCSVYCVANDTDAGGHYTCDPATGDIVCRPGKLCADVHQSTKSPPRAVTKISESSDEPNSSHIWLYILICAICIVLLGAMVLIAFLCTRRRKVQNQSQTASQTVSTTSASLPTPLPPSLPEAAAAAAASFCVVTDTVDFQASNKLYQTQDKLTALNSQQEKSGKNAGNIYEPINIVPDTYQNISESSSSRRPLPVPPPEAAAAAGIYYLANGAPPSYEL